MATNIPTNHNRLSIFYPELCKEWNFVKNLSLPENYTKSSKQKVWWNCQNNHEWQAVIGNRTKNKTRCPYCFANRASVVNNLSTTHQGLLIEWDFEKNNVSPTFFTFGSHFKAFWKCSKGHTWQAAIKDRSANKSNCPYCNSKIATAETSFVALFPDLLKEWDDVRNPNSFLPKSGVKIRWKCQSNHEWVARICDRANGSDCPKCYACLQRSKIEIKLFDFVKNVYDDAEPNNRKVLRCGLEVDIYVPSIKKAIEINGVYFHSGAFAELHGIIEKDKKKREAAVRESVDLMQLEIPTKYNIKDLEIKILDFLKGKK